MDSILPERQHHQPSARIQMLLGRHDERTTLESSIQFERRSKQTRNVHQRPFLDTTMGNELQEIYHTQ